MIYEYSTQDRIKSPHAYMYTRYYGRDFLASYYESREGFLNRPGRYVRQELIESSGLLINDGNIRGGSDKNNTRIALLSLIKDILTGDKNTIYNRLSAWVKGYETTKRLYVRYDNEMKSTSGDYDDIDPYILLALACGLYYSKYGNLKFLNCLLKLGDVIVSCRERIKNDALGKMAGLAVEFELWGVRELVNTNGIRL